jgi:hypothetical protein
MLYEKFEDGNLIWSLSVCMSMKLSIGVSLDQGSGSLELAMVGQGTTINVGFVDHGRIA